jgi:hypothetical protein
MPAQVPSDGRAIQQANASVALVTELALLICHVDRSQLYLRIHSRPLSYL